MWNIIRRGLFRLDPEKAHQVVLMLLNACQFLPFLPFLLRRLYCVNDSRLKCRVGELEFSHPVGLAAGFDKDATGYNGLANVGFSFIEVGTITPQPQKGNPPKRLFRLEGDKAIINRMGFNNEGMEAAKLRLLKQRKQKGIIIGGNIGKNKETPNEEALKDYLSCFRTLFSVVDYFTVNVSSPNTPHLRELQQSEPLCLLLKALVAENNKHESPKPIFLKISPGLSDVELLEIISIVEISKITGVIATNTTIQRDALTDSQKNEVGGLSGAPLTHKSTEVIRFLHTHSHGAFPIIGVGGIMTVKDALDKLEAGASLLQLYTGFVFHGPKLVKEINQALLKSKIMAEEKVELTKTLVKR